MVAKIIAQAESEGRFFSGATPAERRAMMRRVHAGELLCVYRNVYARAEHAHTLNPTQRSVHLVRASALLHPD